MLSTDQVANLLGITYHGARLMLIPEAAGTPPITCLDGRWVLLGYHLKAAYRPDRINWVAL